MKKVNKRYRFYKEIFELFVLDIRENRIVYHLLLNQYIDLLELSLRTTNVLMENCIFQIYELVQKNEIFIKNINGIDEEGFNEIIKSLNEFGLNIGMKL